MTENEYSSLKKGDIVTKGEQYFIVFDTFDDKYIDTQELGDIGKENEFGFTHTNLDFNYTEVVRDTDVITAVNKWLDIDDSDVEPYSFIAGFKSSIHVSEKSESLKDKVIEGLLDACLEYYNSELVLHELVDEEEAEERSAKAYNDLISRCHDYIAVLSCEDEPISEDKLNFNYI